LKLWEPVFLERDIEYCWQIGPLSFWMRHSEDEWLVASESQSTDADSKEVAAAMKQNKPEGLEWTRFIFIEESGSVQLVPALQDKAIVVGSEMEVKILPGNRALFFVSIPVWIRILVGGKKKGSTLIEIPTVNLSNTWFGDPMTGELGYSLTTRAQRTINANAVSQYRAVCPVVMKNSSSSVLDFQKLCIHVENLRVYKGKQRLWTNEVRITYAGESQPSRIDISDKKPTIEEECTLLCGERIPFNKSILKKSVSIFKYFSSLE
jgi:hypothetical protein